MTQDDFIRIIDQWPLDDGEIAKFLGIQRSRVSEYRKGNSIPPYIAASIEAHDALPRSVFSELIKKRLH